MVFHSTEGYERIRTILKAKFEKPSEVTNAHIQCIYSLPTITETGVGQIHDFYEKLVTHSQALDTMGKLKEINGCVILTHDKLRTNRADLVRTYDHWQEWNFCHFIEAWKKCADRNPIPLKDKRMLNETKRERIYGVS